MSIPERRLKCRKLMQRHYADVPSRQEVLDAQVSEFLDSSTVLMDAGSGIDLPLLRRYEPRVALAVGIDLVHPAVAPSGRVRAMVGNLESMPLRADSVDVVVSRSVVEHLTNPMAVFREVHRVLRPGGKFVFTTPNKYYYSCLIALLVPEWLKAIYFRRVFGEDAYDHFPVRYRANTPTRLARLAEATDLKIRTLQAVPHYPYYLMFSPLLFRLGIAYDRVVAWLQADRLQSTWLIVMEK